MQFLTQLGGGIKLPHRVRASVFLSSVLSIIFVSVLRFYFRCHFSFVSIFVVVDFGGIFALVSTFLYVNVVNG